MCYALSKKKKLKRRKKIKKRRLAIWSLARGSTKKKSSPKTLSSEIGQNLPNSSFLEKILLHSMRMKHFSKLDCFWNYLFPLGWSLTWTKKKKTMELEFHLYRTQVPCEKSWNSSFRDLSSTFFFSFFLNSLTY